MSFLLARAPCNRALVFGLLAIVELDELLHQVGFLRSLPRCANFGSSMIAPVLRLISPLSSKSFKVSTTVFVEVLVFSASSRVVMMSVFSALLWARMYLKTVYFFAAELVEQVNEIGQVGNLETVPVDLLDHLIGDYRLACNLHLPCSLNA